MTATTHCRKCTLICDLKCSVSCDYAASAHEVVTQLNPILFRLRGKWEVAKVLAGRWLISRMWRCLPNWTYKLSLV